MLPETCLSPLSLPLCIFCLLGDNRGHSQEPDKKITSRQVSLKETKLTKLLAPLVFFHQYIKDSRVTEFSNYCCITTLTGMKAYNNLSRTDVVFISSKMEGEASARTLLEGSTWMHW